MIKAMLKYAAVTVTITSLFLSQTIAADTSIEEVVVIGSKEELNMLAGSGAVLDERYLDKRDDSDLHRALAEVPGLYIREEDGYGLRPNICLLYTSPSPRDATLSRMPSSA